ncbi:hypothetical protein ACVR1I_07625 [Streptococcus cameli]
MPESLVQILKTFNGNDETLVSRLIAFLKENHRLSKKYITETALDMLYHLDVKEYIFDTSDQDYILVIDYLIHNELTDEECFKEVAMLIWDMITFMTNEECPSCNQTNLRLYTDQKQRNLYEVCIECLARRKNGEWEYSRREIYPAKKELVDLYLRNKQGN